MDMPRTKVRNDPRLFQEMEAAGIDVLISFSMENVLYLSGALFTLQDMLRDRLAAAGVVRDGRDFLVAATNEMSVAQPQAHVGEFRGYVEFKGTALTEIAALMTDWGLDQATIGIEKRYLMAEYFEELAALLPRARLVACDGVLEIARAIKTPDHIQMIGHANRQTEKAVLATFADIRPGATEKAMALRLLDALYEAGAETLRHLVLTVGDNARHAHPYPSADKFLEPGDIIRLDVGGLFNGQGSDIARMGMVGDPSPAQAEQYRILRESQRETAAVLVPGVTAGEVYQTAVDAYTKRGVIAYRRDHVGHSLSILGGHDNPMLYPGSGAVLEENMVIALEPIFPDDTGRRYTLEDIFVVKPGEPLLLTDITDTTHMLPIR